MPSVKSNYDEIMALVRTRKSSSGSGINIFSGIYLECCSALEGGYITQDRATKLLSYLETNIHIRSIFPNNLLYELLSKFCRKDGWSPDNEGVLLDFIATFYLNYRPDSEALIGMQFSLSPDMTVISKPFSKKDRPDMIRPPDIYFDLIDLVRKKKNLFEFEEITRFVYDPLPQGISFKDLFVGFTGNFDGFTRKSCFDEVRKFGGVPCDPSGPTSGLTDYFFVANKSITQNVISRKLSEAIGIRRTYGNPLIFSEDSWKEAINKLSP